MSVEAERRLDRAEHGGDVATIALRYGIPPEGLLDFSANLNPLGPPASLVRAFVRAARDRAELGRYPDDAHAGLTRALAGRHGIDPASIVIANGAAALLDASVRVRRLATCLVPEPAFSEDERALAAAGTSLVAFQLRADEGFRLDPRAVVDAMHRSDCEACLITNPHNPSGALASRDDVGEIARAARERGALAIVDEAFVDYASAASIVDIAATEPDTIVLRSLTKFFAVPALRVGYAVCEPALARLLRATLPPWPVTPGVARALVAGLADRAYERRTLARNARERARLASRLRALGCGIVDGAANFLLVALPPGAPSASDLTRDLIVRERVVVRDCTGYRGLEAGRFVRVAVRGRRDGERLATAFARALARGGTS